MKNKKGFLARDWVTAFIVFSAVIGLVYIMVQGIAGEYGNTEMLNPSFEATYNKYSNLQGSVSQIYNATTSEKGLTILGTASLMFDATYSVIQIILSTLTYPGAMLSQFSEDMGMPSVVGGILFSLPLVIITLIVVLAVLSSITNRRL